MQVANFGKWNNFPGLHLSPYGLAIASQYETLEPWYCVIPTNLTNVAREQQNVTTDPLSYDVLIVGAHIQMTSGDNGQNVLLQVSDLESGRLWTVPEAIAGTPASAYGGVNGNAMPVIQLPENFFLPGGVLLKHEWKTYGTATGGNLTWIGLAMKNPIGGKRPETVIMPDGETIPIGSRLPWFDTVGLGEEISIIGSPAYVLGANNQFVGYSSVMDCNVSITGMSANWFVQNGLSTDPANLLVAIADKGAPRMWSPAKSPATLLLGDPASAFPVLPFTVPYELEPGHRMQFAVFNRNSASLTNGYITLRGVQHCI